MLAVDAIVVDSAVLIFPFPSHLYFIGLGTLRQENYRFDFRWSKAAKLCRIPVEWEILR